MLNRENLLAELDVLIKNLNDYKGALEGADRERLKELLAEGRRKKEEI